VRSRAGALHRGYYGRGRKIERGPGTVPGPRLSLRAFCSVAAAGRGRAADDGADRSADRNACARVVAMAVGSRDRASERCSREPADDRSRCRVAAAAIAIAIVVVVAVVEGAEGGSCDRARGPDGTAYDIAGRGKADESSMKEAILLAAQLARRRQAGRTR